MVGKGSLGKFVKSYLGLFGVAHPLGQAQKHLVWENVALRSACRARSLTRGEPHHYRMYASPRESGRPRKWTSTHYCTQLAAHLGQSKLDSLFKSGRPLVSHYPKQYMQCNKRSDSHSSCTLQTRNFVPATILSDMSLHL